MEKPPKILSGVVDRETEGLNILWSAKPDPWTYARNSWLRCLAGLGIFIAVLAIICDSASPGKSHRNGAAPDLLFGFVSDAVMITVGLRLFFSPVYAMWKAERVFYVVTGKSAIVFEKVWSVKIHVFHASGFGGFERISWDNRAGDIIFDRKIERQGKGTRVREAGFIGIKDYAEAERALKQMLALNPKPA